MANTYWPFENADTTETQYSQLFRRLQNTGVWGSPSDTTLKAFADSSGLNIKLPAGYAFVRGHMFYNDTQATISIVAGEASARKDLLVLRLDPAANTILPVVLKGTAGQSSAPAVTQTDSTIWDLAIAEISVAANATTITPGNVVDKRTYMGHIFGMWETSTRPVAPRPGQPGWNATSGVPEFWTGTQWTDFLPGQIDAGRLINTLHVDRIPGMPASKISSGILPIERGGTGGGDSAAARTALSVYSKVEIDSALNGKASSGHTHDLNTSSIFGTLPVSKGGTGSGNIVQAKLNLGLPPKIYFQTSDPGASDEVDNTLWISWV